VSSRKPPRNRDCTGRSSWAAQQTRPVQRGPQRLRLAAVPKATQGVRAMSRPRRGVVSLLLVLGVLGWARPAHAQPPKAKNLLPNPSFERLDEAGRPVGWFFHDSRAGARVDVDDQVAHTGRRSVKLTNPHGLEPHVYGTLWCEVPVRPNQAYTLSLYARSANPGAAWFGCGPHWERRMPLKPTGGQWQRFTLTFMTGPDECLLQPRINVDSQTDGLWIDSVQLEEGQQVTDFDMPMLWQPGQRVLKVAPARVGENLLANGSFEEWEGDWPKGWRWDKRNTDATLSRDASRAHSGRYSLKLTNHTAFGPHVYGQLLYAEPIKVRPQTTYTISAYVAVDSPGLAWVGGAKGWRVRALFPDTPTAGRWLRVHRTFTTEPDETEIRIMVITESPTDGLWVDDVKLEEGDEPTPTLAETPQPHIELELSGCGHGGTALNAWLPDKYPPGQFVFGQELWASGYVLGGAGRRLTVRLWEEGQVVDEAQTALPPADCVRFHFGRELSDRRGGRVRVEALLEGEAGPVTEECELVTEARIRQRLSALQALVQQLRQRVAALSEAGHYPRVTLTVAENFLPWIAEDVAHGELARAWGESEEVEELVRRALQQEHWPLAPKFVTSPVEIRGPSFIATVRWPDGRRQRQPVFFLGMGPFGQARRDVELFPAYGFNIMQIEFGPNSVLPSENEYRDDAIQEFLAVCDRAAKAGVQVNLLISPHYFPDWALQKWPFLAECSGGFFRYCVHAPEGRGVLAKFIRYTIPKIRGHPALHSICLSNEPVSTDVQRCRFLRSDWHAWLEQRYGTIDRLNATWGTQYAHFADVPVPPGLRPEALVYDFVRFNQEEFAAFHRFLADTIHALAPELPVHAKMMICAVFSPHPHGPWSIAPELFAPFCAINGNDAWRVYSPHGEWASAWQEELMGYELQRCAREAPVFNSEDHLIPDREVRWQSPTYIYNVYWQGAVHGRSASSAWVWERTYDPSSDFAGSILHRPECIEAAGRCALDLNRLAPQVTALQQAKPPVALVYALAGYVWDPEYPALLRAAWRAATFAGYKTGFVYERQLEALAAGQAWDGYLAQVRILILPGLRHLSTQALAGLQRFTQQGGRLVVIGERPAYDAHGRPATLAAPVLATLSASDDQSLMASLAAVLRQAGLEAPVQLVADDARPVYGVEYFAVAWQKGWLVNVSNYRRAEPRVRLLVRGRPIAAARELISGRSLTFPTVLPSLQPLLLQLEEP
jgi:hypothetical protein